MARQTPAPGEIYLDHAGWFVPDIAQAGAAFARLGFLLTPFVAHHNVDPATGARQPFGTGNRCAMLQRGYLEIVSAIEGADTELAREQRAGVARYIGAHLIALSVDDIETAHARLEREGFAPPEPVQLRRPIRNESGGDDVVASFSVVRPQTGKMPEGRIQILTQETPELVWRDSLITRANHITALASVLLCVADPGEAAERYGRFTGKNVVVGNDYATITLDRGRLAFASPGRVREMLPGVRPLEAPAMVAIGLHADDVRAARHFFTERQIEIAFDEGERFCIGPAEAVGAALVVHAANDVWPPLC